MISSFSILKQDQANPHKTQPTQIAAVAIHARKLELQPGGVFNSEIRPIIDDEKAIAKGFDPLEEKASRNYS